MKKYLFLLLIALLSACQQKQSTINGYIEGEYLYIAPTSSGTLAALAVDKGDKVAAGQSLFSLDLTKLRADRDASAALLSQATATLENLTKGKRPEEIAVLEKQKAQAEAVLRDATSQLKRIVPLSREGIFSKAQRDTAQATYDQAEQKVAEIDATLTTARLGARVDEIKAASGAKEAARQKLAQSDKLLAEAAPVAPAAGQIEDVFYRPGEFVSAGAPVVSLLPPENVKVRFFVPEKIVSQLQQGETVKVKCDGCTKTIEAKITFIASQSEYTPPVIYSVGSRDKLVFMIEAKPLVPDPSLHPGLPVDIDLQKTP